LSAELSPVDVLSELPASRWDVLARGVRRAVDQLSTAEVPVALRPFSHWHPEALRDASRARRAVASAVVSDARFRAEVAKTIAGDDLRARALTLDPVALRNQVGGDQAVALLAVTEQWEALATLAAVFADERSAANRTASEDMPVKGLGSGSGSGDLHDQVRALRRKLQQAERREGELRRQLQRIEAERDHAQAAAQRAQGEQQALLERHDRERAAHRERLARLRRRVGMAERRAAESEQRRAQIVDELVALSERLRSPLPASHEGATRGVDGTGATGATGADVPAGLDVPADAEAIVVPQRVRPATPGRPCRLPGGVDPDSATAVAALLQIPGLRVFIDGYNVTWEPRAVPDAGLGEQRSWLVRQIGALVARYNIRPTVVFDGQADVEGTGPRARGVIVCFATEGTADELLVSMLDDLAADEPVLVVSSDREIRDAVTIRDANSVPAGAFVEALWGASRPPARP
jgi:hypothetical protein